MCVRVCEWESSVSGKRALRIPNKIRNQFSHSGSNTHMHAAFNRVCIIVLYLSYGSVSE